jgi:HK97 family phage prohead protease
MAKSEIRTYAAQELRVDTADGKSTIRGSIAFNQLSLPMGFFTRFREKIDPAAFDATLNDEQREVMAYWGHDISMPLGRRSRGTLRVWKSDGAVQYEIDAPDTSWGRDAVASIERGDVQGTSFRFRVLPEGERWEEDADGNMIRTLTNVTFEEVSPTAEPAYPVSSASVRSLDEVWTEHEKEIAARESRAAQIRADRQRRGRLTRDNSRRIFR